MTTLHEAVYAAYTNAGVVSGNDIESLVVLDREHQPMTIDLTVIANKLAELQAAQVSAQQAEIAAKASAQAKLAALGLTEEEVKAILGITS